VVSEGICAAAAMHFKKAVRYIPSLHESMLMSSKRHPFHMDVKLAADQDGKLTAYCNDMLVDNGAYYSIGHVVVYRALQMLSGSYHIPTSRRRASWSTPTIPGDQPPGEPDRPRPTSPWNAPWTCWPTSWKWTPLSSGMKNLLGAGTGQIHRRTVTEWPCPADGGHPAPL
jgi:aldehyde oxidoreductase